MTLLRRIELVTLAAALAVLVALVVAPRPSPAWGWVAAFAAIVVLSENSSILLPSAVGVSPSFMAVMACIAILDGEGHETLLSAALVGAASGLYLEHLRRRELALVLSNAGQYLLASVAAAAVFALVDGRSELAGLTVAVAATCAFGVVNVALVVPLVARRHRVAPSEVWRDLRPALPNYLAFGLVGLFLGLLTVRVGWVAVILLGIPMAIGRWTFMSFLRTREAHEASIRVFVRLIEAKDPYTAGHTERVAKYALFVAEELGLDPSRVDHLRHAALMHDVGKLAVPSVLLNKPGRLTAEEYEVVRRHNDAALGILSLVDFMRGMAVAASDRLGHYQHGALGAPDDLVVEAHIVAVADAFDAMTSTRAYRRALDQDVAFEELRRHAGTQFDPDCVEALVRAIERRGERYGAGHEVDAHTFPVPPPEAGVGSAGLGHLAEEGVR
jgi:HD domain